MYMCPKMNVFEGYVIPQLFSVYSKFQLKVKAENS